jgi:outer membrane protein assembly factor BamD (BamD/ComL family)
MASIHIFQVSKLKLEAIDERTNLEGDSYYLRHLVVDSEDGREKVTFYAKERNVLAFESVNQAKRPYHKHRKRYIITSAHKKAIRKGIIAAWRRKRYD